MRGPRWEGSVFTGESSDQCRSLIEAGTQHEASKSNCCQPGREAQSQKSKHWFNKNLFLISYLTLQFPRVISLSLAWPPPPPRSHCYFYWVDIKENWVSHHLVFFSSCWVFIQEHHLFKGGSSKKKMKPDLLAFNSSTIWPAFGNAIPHMILF